MALRTGELRRQHLAAWGENVASLRLQALGFEIRPKGGFASYDIKVSRLPDSKPVSLRIEVRTSRWKNEGLLDLQGQRIFYWGWRVKSRGRPDPACDYLVGVAKPEDEESDPRFFIFTRSEALMQPTLDLRDTIDVKPGNVAKKIDFLGSLPAFERARQAAPRLFSSLEETLHRGPDLFERAWWKIR